MPGLISVSDFVREVKEDFNSPTTSNFVHRIPQCRETVNKLEEALSSDREGLHNLKKHLKSIQSSGNNHANCEIEMSKILDKLGESTFVHDNESDDVGAAFQKFAVVTRDLAMQLKNLMQSMDQSLFLNLDRLLKNDLKGSKGDLKRPVDRSWKDYQDKFSELERQKKKAAKEAGLHRNELLPGEIADDMDKERKYLQLTTADYLYKVNDIKTKKGVNLVQNLIEYYKAQCNYFAEGKKTIEHLGSYIENLTEQLAHIESDQEQERKALHEVKSLLKNSPGFSKVNSGSNTIGHVQYTLHQAKGDASKGNRKSGYLLKRSEGRLRNVWQKRKCSIGEGYLEIYHGDESKPPTKVNLLTCQMKPATENDARVCFDVVSYNRTYHFQAENEADKEGWMSVLLNSKEGALNQEFANNGKEKNGDSRANQGLIELKQTLVAFIRQLPGNDKCCDCLSTNDVTWLSTNFGVIMCIECSGIHREMGVHISKIQSLTLDNIGTSQLLIARVMSNDGFNKIMEADVGGTKIHPNATMDQRKSYIKAKYEERRFVRPYCHNPQEVFCDIEAAIDSHNIYDLLQGFGDAFKQNVDITDPLPTSEYAETPLHHAISQETGHSLHIVDFLVQNSSSLDKRTKEGNTPLHYCVIQNQCESMRLLLRSGGNPNIENNNAKTPLDIAKERGHKLCEEMLMHNFDRKKTMFENVNIDWHLGNQLEDGSTDFSDDETLEDSHGARLNGTRTPDSGSLAASLINSSPDKHEINQQVLFRYNTAGRPGRSAMSMTPVKITEWSETTAMINKTPPGQSLSSQSSMLPPPIPSGKKPSIFSASNLSIVGSLKKSSSKKDAALSLLNSNGSSSSNNNNGSHSSGSSRELSYNTLPNFKTSPTSKKIAAAQAAAQHNNNLNLNGVSIHKRSPSSDSGHGTLFMGGQPTNSRSTTPSIVAAFEAAAAAAAGRHTPKHTTPKNHTVFVHVGPQSGGSSDISPPNKSSYSEDSSPETRISPPNSGSSGIGGSSTPSSSSQSNHHVMMHHHMRSHSGHRIISGSGGNRASTSDVRSSGGRGGERGDAASTTSTSRVQMKSGLSTESLEDSLSDESNSHLQNRVRLNPVAQPRHQSHHKYQTSSMRRCRALYDCEADNEDELTFEEGQILVVINEETEDENWMEGMLEANPGKRGLFPVSFVHFLDE